MPGNDSAAWVRGGAINTNQDPADGISALPTISTAADKAADTWRTEAHRVIGILAGTGAPFHCDDVAMLAGDPPSFKQLGSALAAAKRQRLVEVAGATIVDGRPVRVWIGAR
jgi:hypothetical protein